MRAEEEAEYTPISGVYAVRTELGPARSAVVSIGVVRAAVDPAVARADLRLDRVALRVTGILVGRLPGTVDDGQEVGPLAVV